MSGKLKVVIPVAINDAAFISSTVPETDHSPWTTATSYTAGQRVIVTTPDVHRIYECTSNHTSGASTHPVTGSDLTKWVDVAPTNRWAMFDAVIGTTTTASDSITVVVNPGKPTPALVVLGAAAATWSVTVTENDGAGPQTWSRSGSFDTSYVDGWDEYMTAPIVFNSDLVLTDMPLFTDPRISVTISRTGDTVAIGSMIFGGSVDIGAPLYGMTMGLQDYSRKETDAFGVTTLVQRAFSRRVEAKLLCDQTSLNSVYHMLANLRATPVVWVPLQVAGYEAAIVYGWYRDFSIDLTAPNHFYCTLQLEGLT